MQEIRNYNSQDIEAITDYFLSSESKILNIKSPLPYNFEKIRTKLLQHGIMCILISFSDNEDMILNLSPAFEFSKN